MPALALSPMKSSSLISMMLLLLLATSAAAKKETKEVNKEPEKLHAAEIAHRKNMRFFFSIGEGFEGTRATGQSMSSGLSACAASSSTWRTRMRGAIYTPWRTTSPRVTSRSRSTKPTATTSSRLERVPMAGRRRVPAAMDNGHITIECIGMCVRVRIP